MSNSTGIKHDEIEFIPYVGMTGKYELKAPYTQLIDPNIEYTCVGVTNLSSYIAEGNDPENTIYLKHGDTSENFNIDLSKNRCLVTLQTGKGIKLLVPNSALGIVPNADGVRYVSVMLGVQLGVIPDYLDLTQIKQDVSDVIFKHLGVANKTFSTIMGGSLVVEHAKHLNLEAARKIIVSENSSPLLENLTLKDTNLLLNEKVTMLEKFIEDNISKIST